jgi:vacuolar-type H+-ATPase subunit F/Vma7
MGRLTVITIPELEAGYLLAGVTTRTVGAAAEAEETLQGLLDADATCDVIALHEPFFNELSPALRHRIDALASPLVISLPSGEESNAEAERRARLLRMLWQAVGYGITFEQGGVGQ